MLHHLQFLLEARGSGKFCNCPASRSVYGRAFPHRAGGVAGCHMDKSGGAKDGIARPGCHCKACELTNTENSFRGQGSRDMEREELDNYEPRHDWDKEYKKYQDSILAQGGY